MSWGTYERGRTFAPAGRVNDDDSNVYISYATLHTFKLTQRLNNDKI
jgi:hypothetical protein